MAAVDRLGTHTPAYFVCWVWIDFPEICKSWKWTIRNVVLLLVALCCLPRRESALGPLCVPTEYASLARGCEHRDRSYFGFRCCLIRVVAVCHISTRCSVWRQCGEVQGRIPIRLWPFRRYQSANKIATSLLQNNLHWVIINENYRYSGRREGTQNYERYGVSKKGESRISVIQRWKTFENKRGNEEEGSYGSSQLERSKVCRKSLGLSWGIVQERRGGESMVKQESLKLANPTSGSTQLRKASPLEQA